MEPRAAARPASSASRGMATGARAGESTPVTEVNGSAGPAPMSLDGRDPLVVPVLSRAGGVGRSTVAAILAAALHPRTADHGGRVVAVCDVSPRSASPWPHWVDHAVARGTGWLAACATSRGASARDVRQAASAMYVGERGPVWVLSDTGEPQPGFGGADPGPQFWAPALPCVRAAVIDAGAMEGFAWCASVPEATPQLILDSANAYIYSDGTAPVERVSLSGQGASGRIPGLQPDPTARSTPELGGVSAEVEVSGLHAWYIDAAGINHGSINLDGFAGLRDQARPSRDGPILSSGPPATSSSREPTATSRRTRRPLRRCRNSCSGRWTRLSATPRLAD
jgi:hypothetical protein